jgi:DNA-binding transcriptional LysR family regulator
VKDKSITDFRKGLVIFMEIRNIKSFVKICESKSFSKAAIELGYSQSSVTMQIKQLESELQVQLFDRIGKTIQITDDGRKFLHFASQIILNTENAKQALNKDTTLNGEIRIGILESVCTAYLPELLKQFHNSFPNVNTIIQIGTFHELANYLNSNVIDILWTFDLPIDSNEWIKAYSFENDICIISSLSNQFATYNTLSLQNIIYENFIFTENACSYRTIFENKLRALNNDPNIFLEIGNTEIIKKFVAANLGISILPLFAIDDELTNNRLARLNIIDFDLKMQNQLFIHKNKWVTSSIKAFLDLVSASFK